jgi:hypothetical protein
MNSVMSKRSSHDSLTKHMTTNIIYVFDVSRMGSGVYFLAGGPGDETRGENYIITRIP